MTELKHLLFDISPREKLYATYLAKGGCISSHRINLGVRLTAVVLEFTVGARRDTLTYELPVAERLRKWVDPTAMKVSFTLNGDELPDLAIHYAGAKLSATIHLGLDAAYTTDDDYQINFYDGKNDVDIEGPDACYVSATVRVKKLILDTDQVGDVGLVTLYKAEDQSNARPDMLPPIPCRGAGVLPIPEGYVIAEGVRIEQVNLRIGQPDSSGTYWSKGVQTRYLADAGLTACPDNKNLLGAAFRMPTNTDGYCSDKTVISNLIDVQFTLDRVTGYYELNGTVRFNENEGAVYLRNNNLTVSLESVLLMAFLEKK